MRTFSLSRHWLFTLGLGFALVLAMTFNLIGPVRANSEADDHDQDGVSDHEDTLPEDHDNDGLNDEVDIDDDSDGFVDCVEKGKFKLDQDNDGIPDEEDNEDNSEDLNTKDQDNDGIPDVVERKLFRRNHDNDAKKNAPDLDDDNDGIADKEETDEHKKNHDNDDQVDAKDKDDDNDGVRDTEEATCLAIHDHDNDGINDKRDPDDDNDGILDHEDTMPHDADNDGIDDNVDEVDDSDAGEEDEESGDDEEATPETYDVAIENFAFSPDDITITVGDSIRWTNNDSSSHTASEENGIFNTGTLAPGESETITFNDEGDFDYFCALHPSMTGRVTVVAADEN